MCSPILDRVKLIIKLFYPIANCGLFFSRNLVGDQMETIYDEDGIQIDICYNYCYFEIFGLSVEEQITMQNFYLDLERSEELRNYSALANVVPFIGGEDTNE